MVKAALAAIVVAFGCPGGQGRAQSGSIAPSGVRMLDSNAPYPGAARPVLLDPGVKTLFAVSADEQWGASPTTANG